MTRFIAKRLFTKSRGAGVACAPRILSSLRPQCESALLAGIAVLVCALQDGAAASTIEPKGFSPGSITAAVNQAAPGDTVHLPAGTFEITEPVRLKSGLKLVGAGQEKTRIVARTTKPLPLISISGCEDVEVAHLTLDGQDEPLVREGISAGNSRRLFLHHITVCNLAKSDSFGPHGILFSGHNPTMERGVTHSTISDCRFEKIGLGARFGGGIRMNWGSAQNRVERNVIHGTGRGGIFGDHSSDLIIRHNQVSGSGGEGLGIEIWGGCPRSLIEDNVVDHWLSVDAGNQSAIRRNIVGTEDGTLKGYGIEIIARDVVVTDNRVRRGAHIGISVSNKPIKNNVYWAYNSVSDCVQWAAQLQGDSGGIAQHYFYRCVFENTLRGHPQARYPQDSGHGFRMNGSGRNLVLEECVLRNNGGLGVQFIGQGLDGFDFRRCSITNNAGRAMNQPVRYTALEWNDCRVDGNQSNQLPAQKPFASPPPEVDFVVPKEIRAGEAASFQCNPGLTSSSIAERLWDFGHGIPETAVEPKHVYEQPGKYRVTLVVWDSAGRGARCEKMVEVLPAKK